ncbi:MAG: hypothetical protein AAF970_12665 [Bacteroidota bacterium]
MLLTTARPDSDAPSGDAETSAEEALFRVAQVLTATPDHAAERLDHALSQAKSPGARLRVLLRGEADPASQQTLRSEVWSAFLRRSLPVAWLTLPAALRTTLLLGHEPQLPDDAVMQGVQLSAGALAERRQVALQAFREVLLREMTPGERYVLEGRLTEDQVQVVLREWIGRTLSPLPQERSAKSTSATPTRASRPPRRSTSASRRRQPGAWRRLVVAAFLIGVTGVSGYLLTDALQDQPVRDLIRLTAQTPPDVQMRMEVTTRTEAENFFRQQLGWFLEIPDIEDARLVQLGVQEITRGVDVPVLRFEGQEGTAPIFLYTYSYAFLDRHTERVQLSRETAERITEDGGFDVRRMEGKEVMAWRSGNEIYVAVTSQGGPALQDRIRATDEQ